MEQLSLTEWIESIGAKRDGCFPDEYRDLYLDIGFFGVQFASCDLILTAMLQVATRSADPRAFELLVSGMDARVKVSRFRQAAKLDGNIGPNLNSRLKFFEEQSIKLRNKLAHSTILPSSNPKYYELVSVLKQPAEVANRSKHHLPPEKIHADRIWKHAVWLNSFCFDLTAATSGAIKSREFEIASPRTAELQVGRL